MPVAIHDKNPRKPRKEGPKAQKAYVEGLAADWDRDIPAEEAAARAAKPKRPGPDAATREKYARLERQTIEAVMREDKRRKEAAKKFVTRESGLVVPGSYGS